jgi:predicted Zn-dependent protease
MNITSRVDFPEYSLENLFEEIVYDSSVKPHMITDEEKTAPLKKMVNHLVEKNGMDSINVYLVESREVNAFAYAGRNLAVYTSLIEECETENELLAVLGHEIGHIEKRHVVRSIKTNVGISIVFSALLGDFSSIATSITTNHMSREFENEADELSVEYLYNADIDPSGFASFMKKMLTDTFLDHIDFFSDHPATQDRVNQSEAKVKSLPEKKYITVLTADEWTSFKNLLNKKQKKRSSNDDENEE